MKNYFDTMLWNTRMFLKVVPLFVVLQVSRCSVVIDSFSQKGIYLSDYCPHMEFCPEGAHVMCMYYDPSFMIAAILESICDREALKRLRNVNVLKNREMGPRCSNPQNVSITPTLANQLLDITNAIRSKIANGRETGFNGTRLPRGFGLFRLKWDNELATFAQVLANQCVLRHDLCRATKKFPDPGQTAGLVRFSFPDWKPVSRMTSNPPPGLDDSKLSFSVTQTLKSWYMKKAEVTEDMIMRYPTFTSSQNSGGKLYMEIINGMTTHMGCGMSGYSEFTFYHSKRSMNYNSIQVICNFSSRPKAGQMTYSVLPARGSSPCGCPEGSQEDSDCLCNEVAIPLKQRVYDPVPPEEPCANPESNCEPTLVLLPIFTVEDAPPDKLIDRVEDIREPLASYITDRLDNTSNILQERSFDLNDLFDATKRSSVDQSSGRRPYPAIPHSLSPVYKINSAQIGHLSNHISDILSSASITKQTSSPRRQYIYERSEQDQRYISQSSRANPGFAPKSKKSSIFNRVAKFKLPAGNKNLEQAIKTDVKPRKDFKKVQRVVNDYFKQRNSKFRNGKVVTSNQHENLKKVTLSTPMKMEENTETILNNVEEKIINFDQFPHKNNVSIDENTKHLDFNYDETDNKLMSLLDTLEREVKYIELNGNEKEIFDAKIRKIYDSVVGKPVISYASRLNSKPISKSRGSYYPMPSDLFENNFSIKHESNRINEDDPRIRHDLDHLSEENTNIYKQEFEKIGNHVREFDYLDHKFGEQLDMDHFNRKDDKPYYDNDVQSDTDHQLFADIENKYNDHLTSNSNKQKYVDSVDKSGGKHNIVTRKFVTPTSRNRYNVEKYENLKLRATSGEVRKHEAHQKYRENEPMDTTQNNLRRKYYSGEDDRKHSLNDRNGSKSKIYGTEHTDALSAERRKYYQEKLENIERKLHSSRRKNIEDRPSDSTFRRLRPSVEQMNRQKSKTQGDEFYLPERARFLHGF